MTSAEPEHRLGLIDVETSELHFTLQRKRSIYDVLTLCFLEGLGCWENGLGVQ